ncbi:MAG: pentapeptide repeat-containing protein, partial [Ilumatobacteraceae bacterium]
MIDASTTVADLAQAILTAAGQLAAKFDNANVTKAGLGAVALTGDDIQAASILDAANLAAANLTEAALKAFDLTDAVLITANLIEVDLATRNLSAADQ